MVTEFSEKTALDLIEGYKKDEDITKNFKDSIGKLLSSVDSEKPFVIFIDELDRCRPLYSIELLERIKHLFNIDNLIFILSIDKKQLSESIKSQYGGIDTNNYLRRFIDLEYRLKNPNKDQFCDALFQKYNFDETLKKKDIKRIYADGHVNLLKHLAKSMDLTLREIKQIFIQFIIFTQTIQPRFYEVHFRVFILFAALKIKDSEAFLDFSSGKISNQDIWEIFFSIIGDDERHLNIIVKSIVLSAFKSDDEFKDLVDEQEGLLLTDKTEDQRIMVGELTNSPDGYGEYYLNKIIKTVVRKLEFTDQFNFEIDDSKMPL
ncbi:Putative phage protein [Bathymodiolus heckerae thiotrophic gill symbiont]|uniref:KAP family P-loop NTPase fold protein n=1 Tax=Bathymodiolus heckerae thiotrophic gill symbiont TaxID=1052212 RepID=UPI0010B2534F|nr:P-loop NTPase fold protein [Bathymodiolus heckerae thiotrophic gill symbiont]CAC9590368.1 Putative phage protein [uncultured Gammaproteobacteria bacterium]SHN93105.1 Putative phage protein [Bathymodiolus heckerae thiotrophic gill symbiont]